MIMQFDMGNTRCKWRVVDENFNVIERGFFLAANIVELNDICKTISNVNYVDIASVAGENLRQQFATELNKVIPSVTPNFLTSRKNCAGVVNSYDQPERLGVDRWLAILAAYNEFKSSCVVFDLGSAITVDGVDHHGCHQGGFILPGIEMQTNSLLSGTSEVRFAQNIINNNCSPGKNTRDAVQHGILFSVVSFLLSAIKFYRGVLGLDTKIVITGGDADRVQGLTTEAIIYRQDLVLDGLSLVRSHEIRSQRKGD